MADMKPTPQQQAVVDDRGGTLLVSAAAGSGKTKVLVDRVMERIQKDGKNINEFLIITFTNAAAAELRSKISKAIISALSQMPENRHLQRQINLLSMAQISTVHAFCGNLIRQYGYLIEVPPDFSMLEDAQREIMLSRILSDVLDEYYEEMTPGFRLLVDTLGAGRDDEKLVELVQILFEKLLSQPDMDGWLKNQTFTLSPQQELTQTVWGRILVEDAKQQLLWLLTRYDWAISVMERDEKLSVKYLPAYQSQKKQLEHILSVLEGPWDQIGENLNVTYPSVSIRQYPDQDLLDQIKKVKEDTKKLIGKLQKRFARSAAQLIEEQNHLAPALESLLNVVETLQKRFSQEKRRKNLLDFSDQEHLAIRLLVDGRGQPTAVAKEVSQQFTEIMVDEYQDSNRVQELIYTAIAKDSDTNRFLVGDVKQSIYSFRQAEPELFLEKYQSYAPAETAQPGQPRYLVLSQNFRSRPEILEAANHVFTTVMSRTLGGLEYQGNERLYPGRDSYPKTGKNHVELDVLSFKKRADGRDDDSKVYQKEAKWVANRIVSLLEEGIPVRDGDGLRPVRPEDIAILFRSRDPMGHFAKELGRAGVPVMSDSGEDIFKTPEVQVLLDFLRVLDNPHQDIPLLAVLCSPVFQFSNEELAQIRAEHKERRFYDALRACQKPFAVAAVNRLTEMRTLARELSAEALVWYLLRDVGLLGIYSAMDGGNARKENLLKIYELARTASGGEFLYLYELVRYLERQKENGLMSSGQGSGGVTLTTIHKSKGLEYPVVFLCDLSRDFNRSDMQKLILVDAEDGIGAKITDVSRRIRYPGLFYEAIGVKKRQEMLSESLRVLYVAMTRPKDYLFMTYTTANGESFLKKLLSGVGTPAEKWAATGAGCLGDWVLLSALNQIEAGELFAVAGRPMCQCITLNYPWKIHFEAVDTVNPIRYVAKQVERQEEKQFIPQPEKLVRTLTWEYGHKEAARIPSKLTATQLKGRNKDEEAAENTPSARKNVTLQRPEFILEDAGLTPAEQGTAAHLFLQYADFSRLSTTDGVISQLDDLVDGAYLTEQQAQAIRPEMMTGLFSSNLGKRLLGAKELIREFKFSLLVDAKDYYPEIDGEKVLLQGVVDAAILDTDGLTVVDFKTDRVRGAAVKERAEYYRGQLETYKKALERIFKKPVKETVLYFLYAGEEITL